MCAWPVVFSASWAMVGLTKHPSDFPSGPVTQYCVVSWTTLIEASAPLARVCDVNAQSRFEPLFPVRQNRCWVAFAASADSWDCVDFCVFSHGRVAPPVGVGAGVGLGLGVGATEGVGAGVCLAFPGDGVGAGAAFSVTQNWVPCFWTDIALSAASASFRAVVE